MQGVQDSEDPRTELDSHANMVVLGGNAFIFESTNRHCNVQPFDPSIGVASKVPIVDGAVAYECPYTGETYILLFRNALHVPHLKNNLIPPFIMRAAGVLVNDRPKIHCKDPTVDDHCIQFEDCDLRIPLQLSGIFSYFHTRMPELNELHECNKLFLTPDAEDWNPNCTSYETNERSMLDFRGEMSDKRRRRNDPCIFEEEDDPTIAAVSAEKWESHIDANISSAYVAPTIETPINDHICDLADALNVRGEVSKVAASLGVCNFTSEGNN